MLKHYLIQINHERVSAASLPVFVPAGLFLWPPKWKTPISAMVVWNQQLNCREGSQRFGIQSIVSSRFWKVQLPKRRSTNGTDYCGNSKCVLNISPGFFSVLAFFSTKWNWNTRWTSEIRECAEHGAHFLIHVMTTRKQMIGYHQKAKNITYANIKSVGGWVVVGPSRRQFCSPRGCWFESALLLT